MDVFVKIVGLGLVLTAGSLLTLRLAFGGDLGWAWLALAGTAVAAMTVIVLLARDLSSPDRSQQ